MGEQFQYKLIQKEDLLVISFTRDMNKDAKLALESCHHEMLEHKFRAVIFYFRNVGVVDKSVLREFCLLLKEGRDRNGKIFIAGMSVDLKNYLNEKGVIRLHEIKSTLEDALQACILAS